MADTENSERAEELLQQSAEQRRHTSEPDQPPEEEASRSLPEAIADAYGALDAGDRHENLTVRDADLAALVAGLEETDQVADVADQANEHLDRDAPAESRAHMLKAIFRVGLQEIAPETIDAAKEGKRKHLTQQADEF